MAELDRQLSAAGYDSWLLRNDNNAVGATAAYLIHQSLAQADRALLGSTRPTDAPGREKADVIGESGAARRLIVELRTVVGPAAIMVADASDTASLLPRSRTIDFV